MRYADLSDVTPEKLGCLIYRQQSGLDRTGFRFILWSTLLLIQRIIWPFSQKTHPYRNINIVTSIVRVTLGSLEQLVLTVLSSRTPVSRIHRLYTLLQDTRPHTHPQREADHWNRHAFEASRHWSRKPWWRNVCARRLQDTL